MSSADGKCCVCAEPTPNRCGACQEAGVDVFFCSREHQKLVYFAHKQVCGEKANPFIWPDLTTEEADDAVKHLDETARLLGLIQPTLRYDILVRYPHLRYKDLPTLLRSLTAPSSDLAPSLHQHLLLLVRANQEAHRMSLTAADFLPFTSAAPPVHAERTTAIHLASSAVNQFVNQLGGPYPFDKPWFTALQHQTLIKTTISFLMMQGRDTKGFYAKTKQVLYELFDQLEETDEQTARNLRATQRMSDFQR